MAADDAFVLKSGDDRIDEPELADGAGERVELGVGDAPGVGRSRGGGRRSVRGRRRDFGQFAALKESLKCFTRRTVLLV